MTTKTATCPHCGQGFTYVAKRGTQPRYCSPEHQIKAQTQRQRERNDASLERRCPRCGTVKTSMEFSGPTAPYCKPCAASRVRERRAIENDYNPLAARRASLARYGLTQERLNAMLEAQGGRCAICQTTEPGGAGPSSGWHVDHDHICCSTRKQSCGKCVRGILCGHCNRLLGQAKDEPVILQAALGYLLAYRARRDAEGHTSS